jgi:hypothetical protein
MPRNRAASSGFKSLVVALDTCSTIFTSSIQFWTRGKLRRFLNLAFGSLKNDLLGSLAGEKSSQAGKRNIRLSLIFLVPYVLARFHAPGDLGSRRNVLNLGSYPTNFEGMDIIAIGANWHV